MNHQHYTNEEIFQELDKTVYGHNYAKKVLINAVNRSKKRYLQRYRDGIAEQDLIPNLSTLLVGGTGTGKTWLIEELSRIMKFPLIKFDGSKITPDNWDREPGLDSDSIVKQINQQAVTIFEANKDKYHGVSSVLSQVVVFIDEFDKVGISQYVGWGDKAQAKLLVLLEGKTELKDVTFILAGAFSNCDLKSSNNVKNTIGFFNNPSSKSKDYTDISQQLISKGRIMAELLGRIGLIVQLDHFTEEEFTSVFRKIVLPNYIASMANAGFATPHISEEEEKELVKEAYCSGLGIRAIKRELVNRSVSAEFDSEMLVKQDKEMLSLCREVR